MAKNTSFYFIIIAIVILGGFMYLNKGQTQAVTTNSDSCSDTDNGNNVYVKGTATQKFGLSTGFELTDSCLNPSYVQEYYCNGDYISATYTGSSSIYCEGGCVDGACVSIGCSDSDSSQGERQSYYTKGYVTTKSGTLYDYCDGSKLCEYYCNGAFAETRCMLPDTVGDICFDGYFKNTISYPKCTSASCDFYSNMCVNDECVSKLSLCKDPDEGSNEPTGIRTTVTYNGNSYTDYCKDSKILMEYDCYKTGVDQLMVDCVEFYGSGSVCSNGACTNAGDVYLPSDVSIACFDSDNGKNIAILGYTDKDGNRNYDKCLDSQRVLEWACTSNGQKESWAIYCENGCVDGICKSVATNTQNSGADTNSDGKVDRTELGSYITKWMSNQITRQELGEAISAWIGG